MNEVRLDLIFGRLLMGVCGCVSWVLTFHIFVVQFEVFAIVDRQAGHWISEAIH